MKTTPSFIKGILAVLLGNILLLGCGSISTPEKDEEAIKTLIHTFLDSVDSKSMHDRFWDKELIYTSSSGNRFGKETIMKGFEEPKDTSTTVSPTYEAHDLSVRVLDHVALVTFELVAILPDTTQRYLNSGTLIRREQEWKVLQWQATIKAP